MKKLLSHTPIGFIYAGGTFGSFGRPLQALPNDIFLPILTTIIDEHFASYPHHDTNPILWQFIENSVVKDSSQLTPADFAHFYQLILQALATGVRQFVVLTGTDTLSYLGAFLAECFASTDTCIVVTGAMQPLLDTQNLPEYLVNPHSDATQNLYDACKLARHGDAGVRVCFAGEHWHAQTVQKIHSHDLMAFTGHHRAGYPANSYTAKFSPSQKQHWLADRLEAVEMTVNNLSNAKIVPIYLVPMALQDFVQILENTLKTHPDAIILLGFGAGNVLHNKAIEILLNQAHAQGCLVAVTTQCPFGGISQSYEAGAWLADCQVVPTGRLTLPAIFARLLWLIGRYDNATRRRTRWTHCLKDTHTVA